MIDEEYPYREALVESEIEGKESEELREVPFLKEG